jgi:hypothetical protein
MGESRDQKSFWATLPGILTAIAAVIVAISGLIGGLVLTALVRYHWRLLHTLVWQEEGKGLPPLRTQGSPLRFDPSSAVAPEWTRP